MQPKILLFANSDWYLYNFRRAFAQRLTDDGYEVVLLSPNGPYAEKLQELGFRWLPAPMERRSLNIVSEFRLLLWLRMLVIRERFALVHGFTIKSAVYGALAARLAGNRPRVGAVAGMGYVFASDSLRARLLRPLVRGAMRLALGGDKGRLILQNSDDVQAFVRYSIVDADQIRLIKGSGVDCGRFSTFEKRRAGQPLRVLLAARLLWDKGVGEFVAAARILRTEGRNVQLVLAGTPDPGNPNSVPKNTIEEWVEEGLINWLGHVDDMPALLSSVHALALPTSYGEGVPRSLLEAGASGLALIATDAPGCREVVIHEQTGLLIPPKSADALARSICRLDDEPAFAESLGAAAQAKVRAEFDERSVIDRTIQVYAELLRT